jgi:hypothetical protein
MPETRFRPLELPVFNEAYQRILLWFFAFPNRAVSLTDLCVQTKTSKTAGKAVVSRLEKDGFVTKKVVGKAWELSVVPGHAFLTTKKVAMNLLLVYESGLLPLVRQTVPNARATILFGSYRKGDDLPESDIDIAIEVAEGKDMQIVKLGIFPKFGYRPNVAVNLHIFSRKTIDKNLFANIANGIVLEGFLEARP